jgi:hypothetical protein
MKYFVRHIFTLSTTDLEKRINEDIEMREQNGLFLKDIKTLEKLSVLLIYEKQ